MPTGAKGIRGPYDKLNMDSLRPQSTDAGRGGVLRKVLAWIAILAIVALLAAVILHPAPANSSGSAGVAPPHWQTVATASGVATGAIAPFATASHWRVIWSTDPRGKGTNFGILVMQPGNPNPYDTIANVDGAGHGTAAENGKGTFYLDVQGSEPYHLQVQTDASTLPRQPHYTWQNVYDASGVAAARDRLPALRAPWRIVWSTSSGQGSFAISVLRSNGQLPVDYIANISGKASGTAYEYTSGSYELDIAATEGYAITVQEGSAR